MTSLPESRTRSTTSRYSATSREPCPVAGSRTWTWAMAAPARAASLHAPAIAAGVTGTRSLRATVSPAPVTAQVMMTSVLISPHSRASSLYYSGGDGQVGRYDTAATRRIEGEELDRQPRSSQGLARRRDLRL